MDKFINKDAFYEFLMNQFNGNLTLASKETGISKSTLCLLKKGDRDIGKNTLLKLKNYCKKKKININKLLFF